MGISAATAAVERVSRTCTGGGEQYEGMNHVARDNDTGNVV